MDMTEGALTNIGKMLTTMKGFLVQGNVDEMEADQRKSVIQTLKKNVEGIFQSEANADYSGRYLFTGYRTDTSLLFSEVTDNLEYKITEKFTYDSFRNVTSVIGGANYNTDTGSGQEYVDSAATTTTAYRLQLAYNNCATEVNFETGMDEAIQFTFTNKEGEDVTDDILTGDLRIELSTSSATVRQVADDEVLYLYDTGEILVGKDVFNAIQENQATVNVNYLKSEFKQYDVRPEMYFKAECYDTVTEKSIKYIGKNIQLNEITWIVSQSGKYYSPIQLGIQQDAILLGVSMSRWGGLRENDNLYGYLTSNNGECGIASNVNSFCANAYVNLMFTYIA